MSETIKDILKKEKAVKIFSDAFRNNGYIRDEEGEFVLNEKKEPLRMTMVDFITDGDLKPLAQRTITTMLVEAIQPSLMVIENLFSYIPFSDNSEIVELKAIEDVQAGFAKNGLFPQSVLNFDNVGSTVTPRIQKVGVTLIADADVIKKNQYGILNIWLSAAGKALGKFKESLGIDHISKMGQKLYDNVTPSSSTYGVTTGRGIDGNKNGTYSILDFQNMYTHATTRGFKVDTVLINPLAWQVLSLDPLMREIVLKNAVVSPNMFPLGSGAKGFIDPHGGRGYRTYATGTENGTSSAVNTLTPVGASFYLPASTYIPTPVKVLVSHLIPITETEDGVKLTDIIMADSQQCAILYQEGEVQTVDGFEPKGSTYVCTLFEKYGFGIWAQGKGITVAKNVAVAQNYVFENTNNATLTPIAKNTPIF